MEGKTQMHYVSADVFRAIGDDMDNVVVSQGRVVVPNDIVTEVFIDRPVPESQLELIDCVEEMNDLDQWVAFEFGEEWCLMGIRVHHSAEKLLDHVSNLGKID